MKSRASGAGWGRRWIRRLALSVAALVLALLAVVMLVLASANLPWVRARLALEVSRLASEAIVGSVSVERIGHIGSSSVSGIDAQLLDASERRVLRVSDVSIDLDLTMLLRTLVGQTPLTIAFQRIAVSELEAHLLQGENGTLSILDALEPASTAERGPPGDSQPLRFRFESVTLGHGSVDGELGGLEGVHVELLHLNAGASIDEHAFRFDLRQLGVSANPLPVLEEELDGELSAAGELRLDTSEDAPLELEARAQFTGTAAGIPFHARARHAAGELSGYVDIEAPSRALRRLLPNGTLDEGALQDPLSLFVGVDGSLERLRVLAVLRSSAGDLYGRGHLTLSPSISGQLSVVGLSLDPGEWLAEVPSSSVQLAAALQFDVESEGLSGRLALRTWSVRWGDRNVPDLALSARLSPTTLEGALRFQLPGATAVVRMEVPSLKAVGEARQLAVRVDVSVHEVALLAAELGLRQQLRGSAELEGSAQLELGDVPWLRSAQLSVTLNDAWASSVGIERARLNASANGALEDPRLSFSLEVGRVSIPNYPLRRVTLRARGELDDLLIQADIQPERAARARLSARVFPTRQTVRDVRLVMAADEAGEGMQVSAQRLTVASLGLEVQNLELRGRPGQLQLDGSVHGGRVRLDGSATSFAPVVLSRQLGLPIDMPTGVSDLSFAIDYRPGRISGKVLGSVSRVCAGELTGGKLEAALEINDNVVDGTAAIRVPRLGKAQLRAESLGLPTRWEPAQISRLTGKLEVTAEADLASLESLSNLSGSDVARRGRVKANLTLTGVPGRSPELLVTLLASDLARLSPSRTLGANRVDVTAPSLPKAAKLQRLDLELTAKVDESELEASAALVNSQGDLLVKARGTTRLSIEQLLRAPQTLDPRQLPIDVSVSIPARELGGFALPSRFGGLDGTLSGHLTASGTLGRPTITAQAKLTHLKVRQPACPAAGHHRGCQAPRPAARGEGGRTQ